MTGSEQQEVKAGAGTKAGRKQTQADFHLSSCSPMEIIENGMVIALDWVGMGVKGKKTRTRTRKLNHSLTYYLKSV